MKTRRQKDHEKEDVKRGVQRQAITQAYKNQALPNSKKTAAL